MNAREQVAEMAVQEPLAGVSVQEQETGPVPPAGVSVQEPASGSVPLAGKLVFGYLQNRLQLASRWGLSMATLSAFRQLQALQFLRV